MAYQLIAFDMDGTLLDSKKEVLPSSVEAIDEALAAGKEVAIASGRCPRMVLMYRDVLPHVRYAICSAGAAIVDLHAARVLETTEIPRSAIQKAMTASHSMDKLIETTCDGEFIVSRPEVNHCERYSLAVYKSLYLEQGKILPTADDAEAFTVDPTHRIQKLNIHYTNTQDRDAVIAALEGEDVNVVLCEKASIEITHASVTKGTGLLALAAQLGIPAEQTIAVGDADNDLPMLRDAGLGVAMGNANENARAAAAAIVADNDHNGCAEAVRRFLLGQVATCLHARTSHVSLDGKDYGSLTHNRGTSRRA